MKGGEFAGRNLARYFPDVSVRDPEGRPMAQGAVSVICRLDLDPAHPSFAQRASALFGFFEDKFQGSGFLRPRYWVRIFFSSSLKTPRANGTSERDPDVPLNSDVINLLGTHLAIKATNRKLLPGSLWKRFSKGS